MYELLKRIVLLEEKVDEQIALLEETRVALTELQMKVDELSR